MEQFYYTYIKAHKHLNIKQYVYKIGSYHYNWHNDIELLLVLDGEVEVCTNGVSKVLEADDLILINSNMGHATLAQKPESIAMVIHIDPLVLKEYYPNIEFLLFNICSNRDNRSTVPFVLIRKLISELMLLASSKLSQDKLKYDACLYALLDVITSQFPPQDRDHASFIINQKKLDAIDKMTAYIVKNYKKKITLDKLAKESGYNSSYVSQLFKSYMGINFYDYLTRIRLREATRDLSNSDKKVLDIALEHGFPDLKAFNLAFKENFSKSPLNYRKQLSPENKINDMNFKKVFLPLDDVLVNEKLKAYALHETQCNGIGKEKTLSNNTEDGGSVRILSELSLKLEKLNALVMDTNQFVSEQLESAKTSLK